MMSPSVESAPDRVPPSGDSGRFPHVRILGTRGIGKGHGGFESFAEDLSFYLVARGWRVTVYCQASGSGSATERYWHGIRLVDIPVQGTGSFSTIRFDVKATLHSLRETGLALVLGYNTAVLSLLYRVRGHRSIMNMDGMEWQRGKYGWLARSWFFINEWLGCWFSDALVADHPEIARHLATRGVARKVSTIAYGARRVHMADRDRLHTLGLELERQGFALVVARPEPENSILEVVRAFSERSRPVKLVVLGGYHRANAYQRAVLDAASADVLFPGAIYDHDIVDALRLHCSLYIHGHTVGGTNPALVEALGAGAPVLAHDNRFNRWVAGEGAAYFSDQQRCAEQLDVLLHGEGANRLVAMRHASLTRHQSAFVLHERLSDYEQLMSRWINTTRDAIGDAIGDASSSRFAAKRESTSSSTTLLGCVAAIAVLYGAACANAPALGSRALAAHMSADSSTVDLTLAPGDQLMLQFPNRPTQDRDLVIAADGRIVFPYLGQESVVGRTLSDVQRSIRQRYDSIAYQPLTSAGLRALYLISSGDVLEIRFRDATHLNTTLPVRPDGRITLPLVKSIVAEGKTSEALESELIRLYGQFLKSADLVVIVREFTSERVSVDGRMTRQAPRDLDNAAISVKSFAVRNVFVGGEVRSPGFVALAQPLSALQSIISAGGSTRSAKLDRVLVLRKTGVSAPEVIVVNLASVMRGRSGTDIALRAFDIVIVPKTAIARVNETLDQYLYQLIPATRNVNFTYFYDIGGRKP
jgi:protein involved in polysaccharide export with SLBB domain/glycosyltransferase involved in cell wall biosynthesis